MCDFYEDEEFATTVDRNDLFDELSQRISDNWNTDSISWDDYKKKIYEAIDKTIVSYTKNDKLIIEDWDMWDQDLYNNAVEIFGFYDD